MNHLDFQFPFRLFLGLKGVWQQLLEVEFHLDAGIGAWLFLVLGHNNSKVANSDSAGRTMRLVETVR